MIFGLIAYSINVQAKPIFESNETMKISINMNSLTCKWIEVAAHAGTINYPAAYLSTDEIVGTKFKHNYFQGIAYLPGDFSCNPVSLLISKVDQDGKIPVKKNVRVYTLTYQDFKDGPITAIETSEVVRLTLPNGSYLESTKSVRAKK